MTLYVAHSRGEDFGPFSEATIKKMMKDGDLAQDTTVWCDGMEGWQRPDSVFDPVSQARGLPPRPISGSVEKVYFDREGVRVTNSRFLPGDQTFALAAINSVKMLHLPASSNALVFCIIFAVVSLLLAFSTHPAFGVAALILGASAFLIKTQMRDSYAVVVSVSSGEVKALVRNDKEFVTDVVYAINDAIVGRG